MSYSSPIETIIRNMNSRFEDGVYRAVQNVGIRVDKAELEKALLYDRNQYVKGFEDAIKRMFEIMDDSETESEACWHDKFEWDDCIDSLKGRMRPSMKQDDTNQGIRTEDPFVRVDDVMQVLKAMSASGRSVNVNARDFCSAVMELTESKT